MGEPVHNTRMSGEATYYHNLQLLSCQMRNKQRLASQEPEAPRPCDLKPPQTKDFVPGWVRRIVGLVMQTLAHPRSVLHNTPRHGREPRGLADPVTP